MWMLYAVCASLVWGLDYALGERLLGGRISPAGLLGVEMLAGAITLLPVAICRGLLGDLRRLSSDAISGWQLVAAVSAFCVGNLLVAFSIQAKNATLASLIEISYPLPVVLFSWALFRASHLSASVVVGGAFIFIGVGIIYWWS